MASTGTEGDEPRPGAHPEGVEPDTPGHQYVLGGTTVGTDIVRRRRGEPSRSAQEIASRIRANEIGPVLSLRTWLMDCKAADLEHIFAALTDNESVHMLSIGRNDALGSSVDLADMLVRALQRGFIWACDWGELRPAHKVMQRIIDGLRKPEGGLATNLAFVFADPGCGVAPGHIEQLKHFTRERRLLDKDTPAAMVSRTVAPWLQVDEVFGFVMNSENITRCFWRPYQEAEFWRRGGFQCAAASKSKASHRARAVPASVQCLSDRFHKGTMDAHKLQSEFPPGQRGSDASKSFLARCIAAASSAEPWKRKPQAQSLQPARKRQRQGQPAPLTPLSDDRGRTPSPQREHKGRGRHAQAKQQSQIEPPAKATPSTMKVEPSKPLPASTTYVRGEQAALKPGITFDVMVMDTVEFHAQGDLVPNRGVVVKDLRPQEATLSVQCLDGRMRKVDLKSVYMKVLHKVVSRVSPSLAEKPMKRSGATEKEAPAQLPSLMACASLTSESSSKAAAKSSRKPLAKLAKNVAHAKSDPRSIVGSWLYDKAANHFFDINVYYNKLFFQEFNRDGTLYCQGELVADGKYLIATLTCSNNAPAGIVKLQHDSSQSKIVCAFRPHLSYFWNAEAVALKQLMPKDDLGPVLLEGTLGLLQNTGDKAVAAARHFVLHRSEMHCYESLQVFHNKHAPLEWFNTSDLKDVTDGCTVKTLRGDSVKLFLSFVDTGMAKKLPAAVKQALSAPPTKNRKGPLKPTRAKAKPKARSAKK